ncbi:MULTISPECIES: LLM class F420-dependent oxidoreductase [unclassified Mycolicibacterium]|uniref:LLM class F420-dependent oxidoreductase n=1 Tax=unclassified Mycolicibacterium TaxID=2636767 RepID=UPI0013056D38|nr:MULTISPECIES: LLM class F420-dependent oxidoreductase [unclassified Mycolicibacterium]MUL82330.1 LLM class F420-dependent oxidoreductase [Mycolicibacterium sp. CBMA 329]MUL88096.1 LLM class F420-dependent oxidoreductase [Mycolicibacterium sp. CBMA 331]MUM02426.1 LLM class F420-dependent oxidoreductase [Mycolicibacterium sp. CBMA 334]MUM24829.1 LLM class F420-dependent oxidoreductase [Mycolicibacterium sp. CBMA 295]MUM38393.1 LLM class F420-dependent oxidoreductase [Mycolicibacterium sp. CBM
MKFGYHIGYWGSGPDRDTGAKFQAAERLGADSVWTAEAYGSDALSPLAWWGSSTSRIRLGTNVVQMAARTPTATAMAAMTLDHLSDGRFVLGLGASGPQVVEGWYGQPYQRPLAMTREYISIVRQVLAREDPVQHDGDFFHLPARGGSGLGKPLRSIVHPLRHDLPIFLAAEGPKNVSLAAEIADGWIALFFSPRTNNFYREALAKGFERPGARRTAADFEVTAIVPVVVDDDLERAADKIRPKLALYIGGMGAQQANFHNQVFVRMGYEEVCADIQALYLQGRKNEAVKAIPLELVEDIALIGPPSKIRADLAAWNTTVVTTLMVQGDLRALEVVADLLGNGVTANTLEAHQ